MKRICVLFHRLGPYHWARLNAAGAIRPTLALEVSGETAEYAWDKVDGKRSFERVTLFPAEDSRSLPATLVARRVEQALDTHQPTAVAIPGWSDPSALAALAWCLRHQRPAILMSESQRNDEPRRWSRELIKRHIVAMCSGGLAGGAPHVSYLRELGMEQRRIFKGYDVVDNDHFARGSDAARQDPHGLRKRFELPEKYFLASSRFIPKKNLCRLLEAFAEYQRAFGPGHWKLVLVGDGSLRPDLLKLRDRLRIGEALVLPGFKQYADLPAYYGLAQAFIHASTTEQWGLVVNEAMASALPVLVSERCGCAPDLVVPGRNGFTFDPFRPSALAQLMVQLSRAPGSLAAMGQASRELISRWSPETFASNLGLAADTALAGQTVPSNRFNRLLLRALICR